MSMNSKRILGGLGVLALLGASATLTLSGAAAQQQPGLTTTDERDAARETIRVGTFQPQAAFERYHRAEDLSRDMQTFQQEMQQAQQEGDQQRMMEIQQRMQMRQNEVIEAFYEDLDVAMPDVAKDADVQVVAVEVVYTDPAIGEAKDLTSTIIEHLNGDDAEEPAAPAGAAPPW